MDQLLLQRTRYVLRSRVRRVQTCPPALFVPACQHLLKWIDNHLVLSAIARRLREVPGEYKEQITKTLREVRETEGSYDPGFYSATSSEEHAAACLELLHAIASVEDITAPKREFVLRCLAEYLTQNAYIKYDESLEVLRDVAIDGLYEYLDEQMDARNVLYSILLKYKQRSEWFHRIRLRKAADDGLEGKTGERALALDLQEYVLDQGVEFVVEPASVSGEADLLLRDSEGRYIIIDAKYIRADATRARIREKIASGFNQVSRYCEDYSEPAGFLVTFSRTERKIRLDLEESDGFRFLKLGGKVVYYMLVDIADLPSASKAGRAHELVITAEELVHSATASTH